ncbi:translocation protein SEC62-like [Pollicipes pollicipes]|uniref:translocation protein SEC62-like n=1 Tax=Pollicipes pollicipes TaxID=41117 RepID=UPI001884C5AE|nr:translocation protein SEC62-like [Pollicipes pollicipes]XP_037090131.1 translocation protein SEC62-like [Pollicipes pollicipes]XP_037090132.1 translocation protein SEC62-like [Pollicipes pollicipes]
MSGQRVKRKAPEPPPVEQPTTEEYAIASYLREHVPPKKTKFLHHAVEYFTAARAVDALLDSPWASGADNKPLLFTDRDSVTAYLDGMLRHKFFHRAKKIAISDRDLRRKQLKKLKKKEEEEKKKVTEKEDESGSEEDEGKTDDKGNAEETGGERSVGEGEASPKAASRKDGADKPKRRIKLDMHLEQVFVDGLDAYVWIYDPIPRHYWLLGALLVGAIVAVCLFPLWPSKLREGVYYLSLAAAGFLAVILVLTVVRAVVFVLLWLATWGRHQLWLLPNLTADVGFFASFWPLYEYEYKGKKEKSTDKKKRKTKKRDQESDNEGDLEADRAEEPAAEAAPEHPEPSGTGERDDQEGERDTPPADEDSGSERDE